MKINVFKGLLLKLLITKKSIYLSQKKEEENAFEKTNFHIKLNITHLLVLEWEAQWNLFSDVNNWQS